MEALAGLGAIGAIFVFILAIAMLFLPFFVWGIYNHSVKSSRHLAAIRQLLEGQRNPAGDAPTAATKVGLFD